MNFKIGQGYNRRNDLHENYGGQHQSGISTPSNHPLIFLFSYPSGEDFGYKDRFDESEMMKLKNVSLMSDRIIIKHNEKVSALFNWAIKQGYTKENVFRGKMNRRIKKEFIEKHFTRDELKQILGNNLEQQFFDKNGPERFWVTQIAAYSDARLNEVCQLNII